MRSPRKGSDWPSAIILRREGIEVPDHIDHGEDPAVKLERMAREADGAKADPGRSQRVREHLAAEDAALWLEEQELRMAERRSVREARGERSPVRFRAEVLPAPLRWAVECLRRMGLSTPEIAAIVMRVLAGHSSLPAKGWGGVAPEHLSFGPTGPDGLCEPFRRPVSERPKPGIGAVGLRPKERNDDDARLR